MSVGVVIPYGGRDRYRARSLNYVIDYHRSSHRTPWIRVGRDSGADFNRSAAVNRAVAELPASVDLLIINDADSFVTPDQLREAVALAREAPGLVRAYTRYRRLSRAAADRCRSWQQILLADDSDIEWQQSPAYAHGVAAIQRACFEEAGGYDPKFTGWGYEDMAFELALDARWPDRRVPGDLHHHWHHAADDQSEAARRNAALYHNRYEPLRGNPAALLALRREDA